MIARIVGPTLVYLFFAGYCSSCLFGTTLDRQHERLTNSRLDFFMLPGKLKHPDFYIRFYKVISWISLLLATAGYVAMVVAAARGWEG